MGRMGLGHVMVVHALNSSKKPKKLCLPFQHVSRPSIPLRDEGSCFLAMKIKIQNANLYWFDKHSWVVVIPPWLGLAEWDVQIYNFDIFFHRIYTGDDEFVPQMVIFYLGFWMACGDHPTILLGNGLYPVGSVGKATGHWSDFLWVIFVLQEVDLPINSMVIFHSYVSYMLV